MFQLKKSFKIYLNKNWLMEFVNIISRNLLYFENSSSYLSNISFSFLYVSLQHFIMLVLVQFTYIMIFLCSLCSVPRHCNFFANSSQLKQHVVSPLGLELLVQQLWTCALWPRVELMPITKWEFTAGIWQELESLLLKPVEYCWM